MRDMRRLVRRLAADGITVLLSSHLLAEVEELCNRVAIVRRGRVAYEGTLAELRRTAGTTYRLRTTDDHRARAVCEAQRGISDVRSLADRGLTFRAESEAAVGELSLALAESGAPTLELTPSHASLEDLFFALTEDGDAAVAAEPVEVEEAA
jgi:ABC-2 type transport system ATP-binding protein